MGRQSTSQTFIDTVPQVTNFLLGNVLCKFTIDENAIYHDYERKFGESALVSATGQKLIDKYIGGFGKSKQKRKDSHGDEKIARLLSEHFGIELKQKLSKDSDIIDDIESGIEFKCVSELLAKANFENVWHAKMNFGSEARNALARALEACFKSCYTDVVWNYPFTFEEVDKIASFFGRPDCVNLRLIPERYQKMVHVYMNPSFWFSGRIVCLYLIREKTFLFIPKKYFTQNAIFLGNNGRGDMKFDVLFTPVIDEAFAIVEQSHI